MGSIIRLVLALAVCACVYAESAPQVDVLIEAGHWKRARAVVESRLRANPNDAQAHAWLSKIKDSFGDLEGSVAEAERAVALDSRVAAYHGQLAEASAQLADRSNVVKGLIHVRRMKKEIAAAYAIDVRHIDTMLVEMMFDNKAPSLAGGDKREALRVADRILAVSPVWGALAHAQLGQDRHDDPACEVWLKKAVEAAPEFYRARYLLAKFYAVVASQKRFDLAEKAAQEAVAIDPGAAPAYEILARVYASQQRWAELESLLVRAEKQVPDDLGPYAAAAAALLDIGRDFRRAEAYLNRYLGQAPEGRKPTLAEARCLLASLFEHEGRKADAVRELQAAVRLDPTLEPAKAGLKRLQHS